MSERAQRFVLTFLALALVVGTGLALRYAAGYRPLAGLPGSPPLLPPDVGIRFEGVRVTGYLKGKPAWTGVARRIETTRARSRFDLSGGATLTLLQRGKTAATLTAPTASYDAYAKRLTVTGDIACQMPDLHVSSNLLFWTAGTSEVFCPGSVRAQMPQGEVNGEQLVVNLDTRAFSCRRVRGRFRVDESIVEELTR